MLPVALAVTFGLPVFLVLQLMRAFRRLRGVWLVFPAVPPALLVAALPPTVSAYQAGSNLWPLLMIFAVIASVVWMGLVNLFVPDRR